VVVAQKSGGDLVIGRYARGDLEEILAIECASFAHPWSPEMFDEELNNRLCHIFVARERAAAGTRVVGYVCFWFFLAEMHLLNIAVDPAGRHRGIGAALLARALDFARERGVKMVFLEVRRGNREAQSLYRRFGFREMGVRPRYYEDGEDALVMLLEVES
jgi:ribosomal-protein-alanine N-acetyltransferase